MAYLAISQSFTRKNYRFIFKEMSNLRYFMYLLGLLKILPFVAINIAYLVPCGPAHNAVRGQAELFPEFLHAVLGGLVKGTVHGRFAEGGVILCNAGQLLLQNPDICAGAAAPQRAAGIAGRNGRNAVGGHQLDAVAVVVAQNLQRVHALPRTVHRTPLLHAGTGHSLAVAVFGKIRLDIAGALHVGVEQLCGQALHHRKDRSSVDIGLVIPGRAGNVEAVAPAGVPLGPDTVQCQTDLRNNIGAQGLLRPGKRSAPTKCHCKRPQKMLY